MLAIKEISPPAASLSSRTTYVGRSPPAVGMVCHQVESLSLIGGQLDFDGFSDGSLWSAIFTFLYVDLLDTTATLFAMAKFANLMVRSCRQHLFLPTDQAVGRRILTSGEQPSRKSVYDKTQKTVKILVMLSKAYVFDLKN